MNWRDRAAAMWRFDVADDDWTGHYVYVAWKGRQKRPLYVGKTSSLRQRVAFHMARAPWGAEATSFTFYRFDTVEQIAIAEAEAIQDLDPIHNVVRNRPGPVYKGLEGVESDQLAIVRRVQGRGRAA